MKRILKKTAALISAAALALSLTACSGSTDTKDATLYGQVESTGENTITLLLGEWVSEESESGEMESGDFSADSDFSGDVPSGDMGDSDFSGEIPSGDMDDSDFSGEIPSGDAPSGSDDSSSDSEDFSGEIPSGEDGQDMEIPDGAGEMESGDFSGDMASPEGGSGGSAISFGSFEAGDETVTLNVSDDLADTLSSLSEGDIVVVVTDSDGTVTSIQTMGVSSFGDMADSAEGAPEGGSEASAVSSDEVDQGSYANLIDTDGTYSDETYTSTGDDENALRIDAATVTLENITVEKTSGDSSDTENGDFYGVNAALLATNGAQVTITGSVITSSAQNGNGVFSYGEGTVVTISDSTITTTADNSGGIQTTGGAATYAYNLTVETSGSSSAAIRSDRGGGTVYVSEGTYTTNGYNSPGVYCTASITVEDAQITANDSEALVVEGANSLTLTNCTVYGNMSDEYGTSSAINVHNIMIYQSTSGDAEEGTSYFTAEGGSITSNNGDMFYITNTSCVMVLSGVEFINNDSEGIFLTVAGNDASNGWGNAGSNGAQVELTCSAQTIEGDIVVDTISTLSISLTEGSEFTGTMNITENEEGGDAVEDNIVVTIDEDSVWTLTGDCTITGIENSGTINFNGYTITLADGTVLSE